MQILPPSAPAPRYQVLVATASENTVRLLQPLQEACQGGSLPESGGLVRTQQTLVFTALDYSVVNAVMRSTTSDRPVAIVMVDVQPGGELKSEQILTALYHSDPSLCLVVLLSEGAGLSQPMLDVLTHDSRVTFLEMPVTVAQVYQALKTMLALWQALRRVAEMELAMGEVHIHETATGPLVELAPGPGGAAPDMHLEVIGSLASGIAHEFNNVLTVIQNQMDLAVQQAGDLPGLAELLSQVMATARNASALSRKLVSFAPEEEAPPASLDLKSALVEEIMLLKKTLGEHIQLELLPTEENVAVWADPTLLSQAIINVALHARGGMEAGGVLQFSIQPMVHETGGKLARQFPDMSSGPYVLLTIEDPNPIEAADGEHASPTPPTEGRLAWVRERLQKNGGDFNATLLPGMIRHYQLLLPVPAVSAVDIPGPEVTIPAPAPLAEIQPVQPSTVLVVDDDETICMIMRQVLATEKHRVIIAKSADEAWQQWCQHRSTIKLLITDINMPGGANGVALGHAIQEQDGSVPVIYTSGHRAVHQFAELEIGTNYLPKPFGMNDLLTVTTRALSAHGNHGLS